MAGQHHRRNIALVGAALALVGLLAFNVLVNAALRGPRLDLTEGNLYSVSPSLKRLVRDLEEPVRLDLYFTRDAAGDLPQFLAYAQRVQEFLEELVLASNGSLTLRVRDPEPFSEDEDAARAAGIAPLSADGAGTQLMLGLVAVNSVDEQEVVPFLDPGKESFLEYDVAKAIVAVSRTERPKLGVLAGVPMDVQFDPQNPRQMTPAWQVLAQMRQLYEVTMLAPEQESLPDDLDLLVLVHPRDLAEPMLRAIDAYAVKGGAILAFVDPACEAAPLPSPNQMMPGAPSTSDLGPLLAAWGVDWTDHEMIGDKALAQRVRTRTSAGLEVVDFVLWLGIDAAHVAADDPITGTLSSVNLASVGAFSKRDGGTSTVTPLLRSSAESQRIDVSMMGFMMDPAALLRDFASQDREEWLAVRVSGPIGSAFPAPDAEGAPAAPPSGEARIVLVGDVDMLQDQFWIVEDRLGPISLGWRSIADNGAFLLNALEVLAGDETLLGLRGRGKYQRPFERVKAIRQAAETKYLAREQELQEQIRATEDRIRELQRDKTPDTMLILSPEQEQELARLEDDVLAARKELRQVRLGLRKDIEALGTRLMVLNVVAWPLVVAAAALAWNLRRTLRQRQGGSAR